MDAFFFRLAAAGKKNEKKCKIISGKRVIFRGFSVLYVKGVNFNQTKPIMKKVILVICVAVLGVVLPSCRKEYVNEIGPKVYIDDVIFSLQGGTQTVKIHGREKSLDLFIYYNNKKHGR